MGKRTADFIVEIGNHFPSTLLQEKGKLLKSRHDIGW